MKIFLWMDICYLKNWTTKRDQNWRICRLRRNKSRIIFGFLKDVWSKLINFLIVIIFIWDETMGTDPLYLTPLWSFVITPLVFFCICSFFFPHLLNFLHFQIINQLIAVNKSQFDILHCRALLVSLIATIFICFIAS